jgi:multiple antibiotic resistance protein
MSTSMSIFSIAFSLFILMDPLGNVPIFIAVLKQIPPRKQFFIIFRELVMALGIIILFNYLGEFLLKLFNVTQESVMIAGGIILFVIALKMIFPVKRDTSADTHGESAPFLVPLAVPLVAGPAVLAAVMLYSSQHSSAVLIPAILLAWVASTIILLSSTFLNKVLGWRGLTACERLMGLILTLIAVQMFLSGMQNFICKTNG